MEAAGAGAEPAMDVGGAIADSGVAARPEAEETGAGAGVDVEGLDTASGPAAASLVSRG